MIDARRALAAIAQAEHAARVSAQPQWVLEGLADARTLLTLGTNPGRNP